MHWKNRGGSDQVYSSREEVDQKGAQEYASHLRWDTKDEQDVKRQRLENILSRGHHMKKKHIEREMSTPVWLVLGNI